MLLSTWQQNQCTHASIPYKDLKLQYACSRTQVGWTCVQDMCTCLQHVCTKAQIALCTHMWSTHVFMSRYTSFMCSMLEFGPTMQAESKHHSTTPIYPEKWEVTPKPASGHQSAVTAEGGYTPGWRGWVRERRCHQCEQWGRVWSKVCV